MVLRPLSPLLSRLLLGLRWKVRYLRTSPASGQHIARYIIASFPGSKVAQRVRRSRTPLEGACDERDEQSSGEPHRRRLGDLEVDRGDVSESPALREDKAVTVGAHGSYIVMSYHEALLTPWGAAMSLCKI